MNKYRKTMVIMLSVLSLGFAIMFYIYFFDSETYTSFKDKLFFLILSVFPSFYFWHIRNKDKLQALQQSRESNEQHNFSSAMQLFVQKDNMPANAIGLQLLVKIKNQGLFKQEIDIATCGKNLGEAQLRGANLAGANLRGANLRGANLQKADLQGANLQEADLFGANVQEANLRGADLQRVRNWKVARWYAAKVTDIACLDEETKKGIKALAEEKPRD